MPAAVPPALKAACDTAAETDRPDEPHDRRDGQQIEQLAKKYPEITVLRTAPGVGPVVAACYVLTLDRPDAVETDPPGGRLSRPASRRSNSRATRDPQAAITKTGNSYLRSLLVQSAQYILGRFGPDSELRRWGLKLAASGGKRGKKRAIVAVARKLAVILLSMWRNGKKFQPFPQPAAQLAKNVDPLPSPSRQEAEQSGQRQINLEFG